MYDIAIKTSFSAAHALRGYMGKCENLHGHNYDVEVVVCTHDLDAHGLGIDFRILKERVKNILKDLDHSYLNDLPPFKENNPSAENIAKYIYNSLKAELSPEKVQIKNVQIWEGSNTKVKYYEV
ncbi:MAG: 6-carboxytetrahydropterin synthase QueD [Thermodesulfobacteriota bacterium]|nr:6-carboxytetrahydropterin synthase QueD [Thermodesulfobacteriota bacterium]